MPDRHFPVRPDLVQLRHQAKELLNAFRKNEPEALEDFRRHLPEIAPESARLTQAQYVLARCYGLSGWPRLVLACRMTKAIWEDDADTVRGLVLKHPRLLVEPARGVRSNWGAPMSYAANLGRNRIIEMLRSFGATDLQYAFDRACLQGQLETARLLFDMGARPAPGAVMGPAETLNGRGMAYLLDLGAAIADENGDPLAPVALVLETYSRYPEGKHRCLELFVQHGIHLPDTPAMAVHRGRIDLLERFLDADSRLLNRTFTHREIYPPGLGCHEDESLALHGTPLAGATLLHLCVDYDEFDLARRLLERGADPNGRAAVDEEGFGGHTPLFGCVVSQPYRNGGQKDGAFARLLLDAGADPNVRASLRKRLRFVDDETEHLYRDVTPLSWGRRFHNQDWVNPAVVRLLIESVAGG